MSTRALARAMGYSQARLSQVENRRQPPSRDFTRLAEEALGGDGRLWAALAPHAPALPVAAGRDLRLAGFVSWLADHCDRPFEDIYRAVCDTADRLDREPAATRHTTGHARSQVTRDTATRALHDRYGPDRFVAATVDGQPVSTSMVARPGWLRPVTLGGVDERFAYQPPGPRTVRLDDVTVDAAVHRLARAERDGTVMVDNPLYRLLSVDTAAGLEVTMSTVPFAEFALGADMLGAELTDRAAGLTGGMPLRDRYLPSVDRALDVGSRVCIGGPNVLVAVARPARGGQDADYVLFVQERSRSVVNGSGTLAVVPKAFHQPVVEAAGEVALSSTILRELEEELLGRADLEMLDESGGGWVDPLHPGRRTPPLTWLLDRDAVRVEARLAVNMVTGNYDPAGLIVVDDPAWWETFGHLVEANWEANRMHLISTLDTAGLVGLAAHPRWSTEGHFAFLAGLARLAQVGETGRMALPAVEVA
jgi:transcriptional regulator with XRE-family HTH domain